MRAVAIFSVRAGIIPGQSMPEYYSTWCYTSEDREADALLPPMPEGHVIDLNGPLDQPHMTRFTRMHMEAMRYYSGLIHPSRLNWAELNWIWV